jgi:hypothetical protein
MLYSSGAGLKISIGFFYVIKITIETKVEEMKHKSLGFLLSIIVLFSFEAKADVNCTAEVDHVQVENDKVLVHLKGSNWHLVGRYSAESTKYKLSVLLAAQASEKKVTLRYPDGYDCSAYETQTSTKMVRISSS